MNNVESSAFISSLNDLIKSDSDFIEGMEIYKITKTHLGYGITANYFIHDQDLSKRKRATAIYDKVLNKKMPSQIIQGNDK